MENNILLSFYLYAGTIRVHRSTLRAMENPKFLRLLIGKNHKSLVVQAYHKKDFCSFRVKSTPDQVGEGVDIYSKSFCAAIALLLGWNTDLSYRISGQVFPKQQLSIFDMANASIIGNDEHSL